MEYGSPSHRAAITKQLEGNVLELSLHTYGCRVIQKAVETAVPDNQVSLVSELKGSVMKCVRDQNGNHVPEIMIRGEQYGDECMACNHATIEEVFEYDVTSKKFLPLSSKIGARKDDIERNNEH